MPIDPICGMDVPVTSPHRASTGEEVFYFCSLGCREKFLLQEESPSRSDRFEDHQAFHVHGPGYPKVQDGEKNAQAIYTCPMHPEVTRQGPGDCPQCGMALEPQSILSTLAEADSADVKEMRWRFLFAGSLAFPVFLLAMKPMFSPHELVTASEPHWTFWVQFVLTTLVLIVGFPLWKRGIASLVRVHLNMFSLILMGVASAYFLSVYELMLSSFATLKPEPPIYFFESAAVITALTLFGQFLEGKARHKTADSLRSLLNLVPPIAHRMEYGAEREVPVSELHPGDTIRIRPGEAIPVDGEIILGQPSLNESTLTGESGPVDKREGEIVTAGTLNLQVAFQMRVTHLGEKTRLAQIVSHVAQAQRSRAPIQSLADQVSAYFVPGVLLFAVLTFCIWYFHFHNFSTAVSSTLGVLIIACPCALGLATPMSLSVGLGKGAQSGILINQAQALETLAKTTIIVLDKTGTLTAGTPSLQSMEPGPGLHEVGLLTLAAGLEQESEHPLARALLEAARIRHLSLPQAEKPRAITGGGMEGRIHGSEILLGKRELLVDRGIKGLPPEHAEAEAATEILMAQDRKYAGRFLLADPLKKDAKAALQQLREMNIKLVLLTGDRKSVADALARRLRFDEVHANVSPEEKGVVLKRLQKNNALVAMVGDGVNDAPALAIADVGLAMGLGSDVAKQTAGITLMYSDLKSLVKTVRLSRAVLANIKENLVFAFIYNLVGIPLASGLVYTMIIPEKTLTAGPMMSPMLAALAMSLSSVCVIGNALRLRWLKL